MTIFLFDRVENTGGKEENAACKYFLLFPQCFPKPFSLGSLKVRIVWYRDKRKENMQKEKKMSGTRIFSFAHDFKTTLLEVVKTEGCFVTSLTHN